MGVTAMTVFIPDLSPFAKGVGFTVGAVLLAWAGVGAIWHIYSGKSATSLASSSVAPIFVIIRDLIDRHIHHKELQATTAPVATSSQQFVRGVRRDVPLPEALAYAEYGEWGKRFVDAAASAKNQANEQLEHFRQLAHDGALTVWGRLTENGVFQLVPKEHWIDHHVEWFDLLRGNARTENVRHTHPEPFLELMVSKAEFEREWPHAEK
jgi:hypothetical protein